MNRIFHNFKKPVNYLAGIWFGHANLSLQTGDQFIFGEGHGLPLQNKGIIQGQRYI